MILSKIKQLQKDWQKILKIRKKVKRSCKFKIINKKNRNRAAEDFKKLYQQINNQKPTNRTSLLL